MADNTLGYIAIILSLITLCGLAYVYVNIPEATDLSGVENDILELRAEMANLEEEVADIDLDADVQEDIDDLKDDIDNVEDNLRDDVNDLEDDLCDTDIDEDLPFC